VIRFNDAKADARGRLWIGSMHTGRQTGASLYRLDLDDRSEAGGALAEIVSGVTVSNGLGWSADGRLMYYVDTPTLRVDVFDYEPATGEATGRRPLVDVSDTGGRPDGLTVDAEGCLWVALARGGAIHRYTPDGRLDTVVPLPVSWPTSCAFGGPELRDLYVTTASEPLSDAARAAEPLAGRLLRLRPGVRGTATVPVAGV
jgi:sugar lactone lactonase YvrE